MLLDLTGLPARFDGALRARRISWQEFHALTGKPIPSGAIMSPKSPRSKSEPRPAPQFWLNGRLCRFPRSLIDPSRHWRGWPLKRILAASNDNVAASWRPSTFPVYATDIPGTRRFAASDPVAPTAFYQSIVHPGMRFRSRAAEGAQVVELDTDLPVPAARRAWLDSLPTWEESDLAGTRIARALKKSAPNAFRQLMQVSALLEPLSLVAANDNHAPDADSEIADGFGHERVQNQSSIRPSIPSMLRALADGFRPHVVFDKKGRLRRFDGEGPVWCDDVLLLGRLTFSAGRLLTIHENGKWRRPWIDTKEAAQAKPIKGSATEAHMQDEPNVPHRYLSRIGTTEWAGPAPMPEQVYKPSGVAWTSVPAEKAEARRWLAQQCEGFPVTKCEPGTARIYGLLSAVSRVKGTQDGATSKPAMQALRDIERDALREEVVQKVGFGIIETIEDALADESFTAIGLRKGLAPSSAHQGGKRAVIGALKTICEKIAA